MLLRRAPSFDPSRSRSRIKAYGTSTLRLGAERNVDLEDVPGAPSPRLATRSRAVVVVDLFEETEPRLGRSHRSERREILSARPSQQLSSGDVSIAGDLEAGRAIPVDEAALTMLPNLRW